MIDLTAPVDIYAQWIDNLEKANSKPAYLDGSDHEDNSNSSDADDYYCLLYTTCQYTVKEYSLMSRTGTIIRT